jgi:ribosomal protein S1
VLSVDPKARRISLTPKTAGAELPALEPGVELKGRIQRIERYGVFVWLAPGKVGLMPSALTGTPPGTDLSRRFPIADEIEVEVVELEDGGRRIRLAAKGARVRAERQRPQRAVADDGPIPDRRKRREDKPRRDRPAAPVSSDAGFGLSLAEKLRAALESARK